MWEYSICKFLVGNKNDFKKLSLLIKNNQYKCEWVSEGKIIHCGHRKSREKKLKTIIINVQKKTKKNNKK